MKKTIVLTAVILVFATALAQQPMQGTTTTIGGITRVCLKNWAEATICFGNEVAVRNQVVAGEPLADKAYDDYFTVRGDTLFIGERDDIRQTFYITVQLDSAKAAELIFCDHSEGTVHPNRQSAIKILACDDSKVNIGRESDKTTSVNNLKVWSFNNAVVKLKPKEVSGDTVCLYSRNESSIYARTVSGNNIQHTPNVSLGTSYSDPVETITGNKHWTVDFSWAFNNWSGSPFNPLKRLPAGYGISTTPTSYQLSVGYQLNILRDAWYLNVALGYESDVFNFDFDEITTDVNDFEDDGITPLSGQSDLFVRYYIKSLSLVTRYVTLPITLKYKHKWFTASLAVIPGISYTSSNTGFKCTMSEKYDPYLSLRRDVAADLNLFKCDIRLSVGMWNLVKLFVQTSTVPLFKDSPDVYPLKFGITIGRF